MTDKRCFLNHSVVCDESCSAYIKNTPFGVMTQVGMDVETAEYCKLLLYLGWLATRPVEEK